MKTEGKVVVLVGAGASQALNIPAMGGMFDAFLQRKRSSLSRDDKRICQLFVDDLGVAKDLEEFLLAANTIVDTQGSGPWKLTEKIISPSLKGAGYENHRKRLKKYVSDIKNTRRHILDFMSQTCFRFERKKACDLFTGFGGPPWPTGSIRTKGDVLK